MFASWPAGDSGDWGTVKLAATVMKNVNRTLKIVTYSAGWIQPLGFISYRAYAISADVYIRGLQSKILRNAPELLVGEELSLEFPVRSITREKDGKLTTNFQRVFIAIDDTVTVGDAIKTKGVLQKIDGRLVLEPM